MTYLIDKAALQELERCNKQRESESYERILKELNEREAVDGKVKYSTETLLLVIGGTLLLCLLLIFLFIPSKVTTTVTSLEPYPIRFAIGYPQSNKGDDMITLGWFEVAPGETRTIEFEIPRWSDKSVFVYGESADEEVVALLNGYETSIVSFVGNTNTYSPIDPYSNFKFKFVGSQFLEDLSMVDTARVEKPIEWLPFSQIELESEDWFGLKYTGNHGFVDMQFADIHLDSKERRIEWCSEFYYSLKRTIEYDNRYKNMVDYPFNPGISYTDDSFFLKGLEINEFNPYDLDGNEQNFKQGDRILAVNGTPVFNEFDLLVAISWHGLSKWAGIKIPLTYTLDRAGIGIISVQAGYFFNPDYTGFNGYTPSSAFITGIGQTASFDIDALHRIGSNAVRWIQNLFGVGKKIETQWEFDQRHYALKNLFPYQYEDGRLLGLFVPNPILPGIFQVGRMFSKTRKFTKLGKVERIVGMTVVNTLEDFVLTKGMGSFILPKAEMQLIAEEELSTNFSINLLIAAILVR